ncbi:CD36 domain containing protein [Asbolus verrucosus]|uniref:CD36 domain containing protein n=1 Tax=Asbolus verrucosus TaxID=1661398 RepID=A0A482VC33_ASBVE|nr:CD36 domain containing protein [Asbolus verrucosus]
MNREYDMQPAKPQFPKFLFCVSVFFTVCGLVLTFIWPILLRYILQSKLVLTPNSETHDPWKKTPFSVPLDFYLFNWTNPEDIYNKNVKPKFQQVGPYRYWEVYEKSNVTWNNNGTVTFRHRKFWHFNYTEPNGDLQARINTINPVILSAAHTVRSWNYWVRKGFSVTLSGIASGINITQTIDEMLFKGFSDPLLDMTSSIPFLAGRLPPYDKFGFFYKRNGSVNNDGVFNMGTGINSTFGKLYNWNYWAQTPYYEGKCGKIHGSAGDFFPRSPDNSVISLFLPSLCRSVTLKLVGQGEVENITGYTYALEARTLDNGTIYPENKCYCNGECLPSGVLNISSCSYDAPFFISLPHFHNADPYYTSLVDGLKPENEKHDFYITLEPNTNIVLEADAKLQINMLLQPIPGISIFEKVPKAFFPLMWSQQHVKIPASDASKLKWLLIMPVILSST